ncbi:hypothetical protein ACF07S_13995 [Streptomyces sp. NPDC016640]|uniref:hypothetical protein n=1 Tax=Streptomyces sp. NPDC016640 TaxID=3364969 RepID=UPI0036FCE7D0
MTTPLSRRQILRRATGVTAGAVLGTQLLASPALAQPEGPEPEQLREAVRKAQERNKRVLSGISSSNGWQMERAADARGHIYTRPVPGLPLDGVQLRMGEAEIVLLHVVRRFHYDVEELRRGDVIGWRHPSTLRKGLAESNQASGTGVQIRPGFYPSGLRGGFFPEQLSRIRDILAESAEVVRWGGDDKHPDEALFYINVPPGDSRLRRLASAIVGWNWTPGMGAGSGSI